MTATKALDKAIKAVDNHQKRVRDSEGKKFFEFTVDYTYKKTGKTEKNVKIHAAGGDMKSALSALRAKYKMHGYDISVKDVKEVDESASKIWIVGF